MVRFVDTYIADVITSLAVWLRDIDYAVQFYATGAFTDAKAEVELNTAYWDSAPLYICIYVCVYIYIIYIHRWSSTRPTGCRRRLSPPSPTGIYI